MATRAPTIWPPALRPGDAVAVIAPAGPMPRGEFFSGLAWLRERYRIHVRPDILSSSAYLAGSDERRLSELRGALAMPQVRAIVAARGGYGATRIIEAVPSGELLSQPRWICGFSDITALHIEAASLGIASLHSANVTGLGRAQARDRRDFLRALEGDPRPRTWPLLERLVSAATEDAATEGRLYGGNLTLLFTQAAAARLKPPPDAIWLVEDIGERPYRIDRMLTALKSHFSRARAIVFGEFTNCDTKADLATVKDVLQDFARSLSVPVVIGAPFGHGNANAPWVQGARAKLQGRELTLYGRD